MYRYVSYLSPEIKVQTEVNSDFTIHYCPESELLRRTEKGEVLMSTVGETENHSIFYNTSSPFTVKV